MSVILKPRFNHILIRGMLQCVSHGNMAACLLYKKTKKLFAFPQKHQFVAQRVHTGLVQVSVRGCRKFFGRLPEKNAALKLSVNNGTIAMHLIPHLGNVHGMCSELMVYIMSAESSKS